MLALLLVLVMLPLGRSMAQTATEIHIVNPHESTSLDISDKGNPYHLNSWVNQVPANPLVEYELINGDDEATTIGTATQVGTDTFEYFWTIDDATLPDGAYTLRATLYQAGSGTPTVVATDEAPVVLNNQSSDSPIPPEPPQDAEGETVEIVYPENAGSLGVYITPDDATREQSFIMEVQASADTTHVQGYYSVTERGTDPVFEPCAEEYVAVDDTQSAAFECTVAEDDFALDVTAVAAVPNDTPAPANALGQDAAFDDSADAHTVTAYFQRPSMVVLEPSTAGSIPIGACTTFTATVSDQNARPIANMNVDVHAVGPDDNLKFDTGTGDFSNGDESQAPDQGNHGSEPAFECAGPISETEPADSGASSGTQGEHQDPTAADRKHVESVTGTDVAGGWSFSLRSAAEGTTLLTAWADADNDDQFCTQEQSASGSIGWNTAAPTPVASTPELTSCTVAEPSPSPSPTPTESTSASPSDEPSSSTSPSPDPSTSVSPSPDPEDGDREFSKFRAFKNAVRKGNQVRFKAIINADDHENCGAGVSVKLKAKAMGKGKRFITQKTKVTNTEGKVGFKVVVKKTKKYKVIAPSEGFCKKAVSEVVKVRRK